MSNYIEEEITLLELAQKFACVDDFDTPEIYDLSEFGLDVLTIDTDGSEVYKKINTFVVKEKVPYYYTDGSIKVSNKHRFIENGNIIFAENHPDFFRVDAELKICDIEVDDLHSYLANGRLNHNTTPGGKALGFHSSVRLRLKNMGTIKNTKTKDNPVERAIGINVRCTVTKNRLAPPLRNADFAIYFDKGIDNTGSLIVTMVDYKITKKLTGGKYTYVDTSTGEEIEFTQRTFQTLIDTRPEIKEQMYSQICNAVISHYKTDGLTSDDVEVDTTESFD